MSNVSEVNTTAEAARAMDQCEEHLQEFHSGAYAFWFCFMFIFFTGILILAAYSWYLRRCHPDYADPARRSTDRGSMPQAQSLARRCLMLVVKPFNSFAVVYFCVCRLLWLLDPHPNSVAVAVHHIYQIHTKIGAGRVRPFPAFLITTPQTLVLLAFTLMISLWRRITNNAMHVRRLAKSVKKETYIILAASSLLLFVALPLGIASSVYPLALSLISNMIFGLYMIVMCSLAFYYIAVLQNIVKKVKSVKTKIAVLRIKRTVMLCITACVLLVGGIAFDAIFISRCSLKSSSEMNARYLVYVWLVHLAEGLGCASIIYALWPVSRKKSERKICADQSSGSSVVMSSSFQDLEAPEMMLSSSGEKVDSAGEDQAVELTQQYASASSSPPPEGVVLSKGT